MGTSRYSAWKIYIRDGNLPKKSSQEFFTYNKSLREIFTHLSFRATKKINQQSLWLTNIWIYIIALLLKRITFSVGHFDKKVSFFHFQMQNKFGKVKSLRFLDLCFYKNASMFFHTQIVQQQEYDKVGRNKDDKSINSELFEKTAEIIKNADVQLSQEINWGEKDITNKNHELWLT